MEEPKGHTTDPVCTGGSVIGIKYKDGIMLAADTAGNFGGLLRYKNFQRLTKVSDNCALATGGELSDL